MSSKAKPAASKTPAKKAAPAAAAAKKPAAASSSTVKKSTSSSAPAAAAKGSAYSHLFEKNNRKLGIGRSLPPSKNLSRFVLWPRYIRIQRHRAILKKRLKVPPALAQFSRTLEKNHAATLFRLLAHYRPESHDEKKKRLYAAAKAEAAKEEKKDQGKPYYVKHGLNHVTHLIEAKKAKLVVIAHDVDPIELVVWLPALCRKMGVPFVIVKGKARLGHLVHQHTATAVAVTDIKKEDSAKFEQILSIAKAQFTEDTVGRKKYGGQQMGIKHEHVMKAREKARLRELAQKAK
jgi:large subunit ribosomal protein L7Ae